MVGKDEVYSTPFVLALTSHRSTCLLPSGDVGLQGEGCCGSRAGSGMTGFWGGLGTAG